MSRYYVGTESGDVLSASGILQGARYGRPIQSAEDEEGIIVDGELYRPAEADEVPEHE